jgi:hypothetical protein
VAEVEARVLQFENLTIDCRNIVIH